MVECLFSNSSNWQKSVRICSAQLQQRVWLLFFNLKNLRSLRFPGCMQFPCFPLVFWAVGEHRADEYTASQNNVLPSVLVSAFQKSMVNLTVFILTPSITLALNPTSFTISAEQFRKHIPLGGGGRCERRRMFSQGVSGRLKSM